MSSISQKNFITGFEGLTCDTRPDTPNMALVAAAGLGRVADVHKAAQTLVDSKSLDPTALDFARLVSPCSSAVHAYLMDLSRTNTPTPPKLVTEGSPRLTPMQSSSSTPSEKNREIIILAISGNITDLQAIVEDLKGDLDLEAINIALMQPLSPEVEAYLRSFLPS